MPLTEQKRHQTMHSVSVKLQQMLPNYTPHDRQTLLEQLDRDALTTANGDEDAYINRMAAKLRTIQRKLAKAQGQPAPPPQQPIRPAGSGPAGRPEIARVGSENSSGSTRSFNQQHRQLMQQQQQALLGAKQMAPAQQMMPPGMARPPQGMQQQPYMPHQQHMPQTPWAQQQQPSQMQRFAPQHQRQVPLQAQQPRGPYNAGPSHLQPRPQQQQPREYDPHQAAWGAAAQRQPPQPQLQPQPHQQLRKPVNGSTEFGILPASPSMEQMVYGLILNPDRSQQPRPQPQYQPARQPPPHLQPGYAQRPAVAPMQAPVGGGRPQYGDPAMSQAPAAAVPNRQPPAPLAQPSRQSGGFMELLTSEAPQQPPWRAAPPQAQVRPEQPPKAQPAYPPAATPLPNKVAAMPAAAAEAARPPQPGPEAGADFTEQYWALMARIQTDIVPSLELLKPRFTAAGAKPEHPDWERLRSKMTEILKLLPRLKIQRSDPRYSTRMWTRQEFEQMQKIERQLGPYCDRFFPKGRPNSVGSGATNSTGQQSGGSNSKPPSPASQQPSGLPYLSQESPASQSNAPPPVLTQPTAPPVKLEAPQLRTEPVVAAAQPEVKPAPPAPVKPVVLDKRQQLLQAAAGYQAADGGGAAGIERLFAHHAADSPLPPPHLLPHGFLPHHSGQVISKKRFQAVNEGVTTSEEGGSPSSVLDAIDGRAPKRAKALNGAAAADYARRKALLEAECAEVSAGLGDGMLLQVGLEPGSEDGTLLVHVWPAAGGAKPRPREWQVLTLRVGPAYPAAPPQLTQPCSVTDGRDFFRAEAAWDILVESVSPCQAPLRVETAARAWQAALAAVADDNQLF